MLSPYIAEEDFLAWETLKRRHLINRSRTAQHFVLCLLVSSHHGPRSWNQASFYSRERIWIFVIYKVSLFYKRNLELCALETVLWGEFYSEANEWINLQVFRVSLLQKTLTYSFFSFSTSPPWNVHTYLIKSIKQCYVHHPLLFLYLTSLFTLGNCSPTKMFPGLLWWFGW